MGEIAKKKRKEAKLAAQKLKEQEEACDDYDPVVAAAVAAAEAAAQAERVITTADSQDDSSSVAALKASALAAARAYEREIKDAFESFSTTTTTTTTTPSGVEILPYHEVPAALIQLCGVYVDTDLINDGLAELEKYPLNVHSAGVDVGEGPVNLVLDQFRELYEKVKLLLQLRAEAEEAQRVASFLPPPPNEVLVVAVVLVVIVVRTLTLIMMTLVIRREHSYASNLVPVAYRTQLMTQSWTTLPSNNNRSSLRRIFKLLVRPVHLSLKVGVKVL